MNTTKEATLLELAESFGGRAFEETPHSPICGGASNVRFQASNIHPDKAHRFDFRRCRSCGHGWIDPMPTQELLSYLYSVGSLSVIGQWGEESAISVPEEVCANAALTGSSGSFLELGVGQGRLYRKFLEAGWRCAGIDPGDWSSKFPGVVRGIENIPVGFQADIIAALDVLEHVVDPVGVLRALRSFAKSGTRIFCATPNVQSARAFWDREKWRMVRPLGHVNYYSSKSIRLALRKAGFETTTLRATDLYKLRFPRGFRSGLQVAVEFLGFGDQWIAIAEA